MEALRANVEAMAIELDRLQGGEVGLRSLLNSQQQQHEQHQQLRGPQTSLHSTSSAPVVRDRPQQWQHNPLDYGEVEEPTSTRWK